MNYSNVYRKIYLASLTPVEILKFRIKNNYPIDVINTPKNSYIDSLISTVGGNEHDEVFAKYCMLNDFTALDILSMTTGLGNFENDIEYPVWFEQIIEILEGLPTLDACDIKKPFYQLLYPFTDHFFKKMIHNKANPNFSLLSDKILTQIQVSLYNDLFEISKLAFYNEFSEFRRKNIDYANGERDSDLIYRKFVASNFSDRYETFFTRYPMLLKKILTKVHSYISFVTTLFQRLESDRGEIELIFGVEVNNIKNICMNAGDQHNGGSTVIIEFENSSKLVYKPCDVSITKAYNRFITWVNEKLLQNLKIFNIINKINYGWMQFVSFESCVDDTDIKLYYERAGILLGVAYFLNANDLHYENVIASGNSPVLIDHETLLTPKLRKIYHNGKESLNKYSGTVLETSLLPIGDMNLPYYGYGYGSSLMEPKLSINVFVLDHPNTDAMTLESTTVVKSDVKHNKPSCDGEILNLANYRTEFVKGFEQIYNLVLTEQRFLLSNHSPLIDFQDRNIRIINRPTKVYYKLLKILNSPDYLSDSIKYGIKLEVLARAYINHNIFSTILGLEREQMLVDNIPVFYINTLDETINFSKKNMIEFSAFEHMFEKIRSASQKDFCKQVVMIDNSIEL